MNNKEEEEEYKKNVTHIDSVKKSKKQFAELDQDGITIAVSK